MRASAASGKARTPSGKRRKASRAKARTSSSRGARNAGVPRDMLRSIEEGQHAALEAVRRFVDTVERALPLRSDGGSRRQQEIVDSALEMADRLVQTQYDLLRKAVRSASRTFGDQVKRG